MHISRPHLRPTQWEILGVGPTDLCVISPSGKSEDRCSPFLLLWLITWGLMTDRLQSLGETDTNASQGGTVRKQGREDPKNGFWSPNSRKEGTMVVSHHLAQNYLLGVCVREWMQAHVCVWKGTSPKMWVWGLQVETGNRYPWQERLRTEAETHSQKQSITKNWTRETNV